MGGDGCVDPAPLRSDTLMGFSYSTPTAYSTPTVTLGPSLLYAEGWSYAEGCVVGLAWRGAMPTATTKGPRGSLWPSAQRAIPVVHEPNMYSSLQTMY